MPKKNNKMEQALVIVESPAKIKTLKKFVGKNFTFESSIGHIRDLPEKGFGIDVENNFEPNYAILTDKKAVADRLIKAAKQADIVYLSPDPDREGEAIAWHIAEILPKDTKIKRVTFNSITKEEVLEAFNHPRDIDLALVDAQQARRMLDRIVGYKISPLLARRVQRGGKGRSVSAGRVQSVSLKFVVDREREIQEFNPVEYWNLLAFLKKETKSAHFKAYLHSVDGKKVEKEEVKGKEVFIINNEKKAKEIKDKLEDSSFVVRKVDKKDKLRNPAPPFITSTLQQEASRYFGFSSAKTMNIAQSLYEGVDMGEKGSEGLITYMRTDSVRISPEAIKEIRPYIKNAYGNEYLPDKPRTYSTKKAAQDAHEAIRPSTLNYVPEEIQSYLTNDQLRLYSLIWKRTVASQMKSAVYDTVSCDISASDMLLRVTGSRVKFHGFLKVYEEKQDEDEAKDENTALPHLEIGESLSLDNVIAEQAFTKPPPRYSEASLVKELERSGIGRPSTYASIMSKIQNREYTYKEKGRLIPTDLGVVIAQMLETNFKQIMDVSFTANMEDDLELVAADKKQWKLLIKEFWDQFIPVVELAEKQAFVPKILTDLDCPQCKKHKLMKIWSRNKYFYGCSDYPECKYSAPLEELSFKKEEYAENFDWNQPCPKCGGQMSVRHGRFGPFLGCKKYPDCRGIINIPKKGETIPKDSDLPLCPATGCDGKLTVKRSRFKKIFFSCSNFPDCDVIVNDIKDLSKKYASHPKTPYEKKTKKTVKGKAVKGTKKEKGEKKVKSTRKSPTLAISNELAEVVGGSEMSRGDVMKKIWDYIKSNNLQDPKNKRTIIPDAKLAKVFGKKDPIDMFQMTKVLQPHLKKNS